MPLPIDDHVDILPRVQPDFRLRLEHVRREADAVLLENPCAGSTTSVSRVATVSTPHVAAGLPSRRHDGQRNHLVADVVDRQAHLLRLDRMVQRLADGDPLGLFNVGWDRGNAEALVVSLVALVRDVQA